MRDSGEESIADAIRSYNNGHIRKSACPLPLYLK